MKSKVIEEHVVKDRDSIKKKFVVDWEEEHRLLQSFVKTIWEMQVEDPLENLNQKEKTQWTKSWARLLEVRVSTKPIVSQSLFANPINNMSMEQIFQDINK